MEYNELKLAIYESAESGEITESQKHELLDLLDNKSGVIGESSEDITLGDAMNYINSVISERCEETVDLDNEDVTESVNALRLNVYEAFENNAITEEERDTFLEYLNVENYE